MVSRIRRYEFKRLLESLREKHGKGTELISVYIPGSKQISDVTSHLKDERGQASNIKSKSTRVNVQSALDSILSRLKYFKRVPENGIVIFCGAIDIGGDRTSMETYMVEPIEPLLSYKYHCNSSFFLEPLEEMLEEKKTFGLIVLDRREATIGFLHGKRIEVMKYLTSSVPGKQRKGGQSAVRFQRLREIAIDDFYKRIGYHASNIFLPVSLEGIMVGGPSPTKEEFLKGEYLHYELMKKIIGAWDVSYTDEAGLPELVEKAQDKIEELELIKEKRAMDRFMRELRSEKNLATYGEKSVRENLELGSVDILLVSEDLHLVKAKISCQKCGYERYETVRKKNPLCKKCSSPLQVSDEKDVVLELAEIAEESGAKTEFISTDFEEGAQLLNAFGGIAAILRYTTSV